MSHLWITALAAFGISLVLTPILRDVFRSFRVVDEPDRKRKFHVYPIPRVGGMAIAISYFVVFYVVRMSGGATPEDRELSIVFRVVPAGLVVFATGVIDDLFGLKPWQKFLGQFLGAGLACWAGVQISGIAGHPLPTYWAVPLTIGWLVLCTNAFNLVDGLDGLAAGVGLFATLTIFTAAMLQGNTALAFATIALSGALMGFLCFNFNPATVFLGDCGSLLIGFLLGCFGVIWAQKSITLFGIAAPIMAMSVPLIDVLLCIVRRWLRNQPIFSADRGHIHHRLLDRGLTPKQTVFILYGLSSIAALFSLAQMFVQNSYVSILIGLAFLTAIWIGVHKLGYAEFVLASRLLRLRELQRGVSANLALSSFEKAILKAQSPEEHWNILAGVMDSFGFAGARMKIGTERFEKWGDHITPSNYWQIRIPLSDQGDYVEFAREVGSFVLPMVVVPFVDLVATALSAKLIEQQSDAKPGQAGLAVQQSA